MISSSDWSCTGRLTAIRPVHWLNRAFVYGIETKWKDNTPDVFMNLSGSLGIEASNPRRNGPDFSLQRFGFQTF